MALCLDVDSFQRQIDKTRMEAFQTFDDARDVLAVVRVPLQTLTPA